MSAAYLVLACAGKMLLVLSPALLAFAGVASLIKSVGPSCRQAPRAQKGRNL